MVTGEKDEREGGGKKKEIGFGGEDDEVGLVDGEDLGHRPAIA